MTIEHELGHAFGLGHYKISEAESDKLFYWVENLMKAKTIEEVFSCL